MANIRWSDRSIGSIGQACLRSDRNFTDGEMTSFESYAVANKEPGQETLPRCKWQMSVGPIDRSDPSEKRVYDRTDILPMAK